MAGLPLMGSHSLLRKQPIWAAGDTPHLMPVEQGLPWHPVATGLAGQAIPFVVTATHAHALPSPPFWFPVPAVLVAVLALVPPGVAPAFCVSVLLLPLSVGAPGCPYRAPTPIPPACPPPVRGFHISVRRGLSVCGWLVTALLPPGGHLPARGAQPPPLWSTPPPLSFPTPGKTVPHHPLGDGHQVTVPHPPLGDHTPTLHAHLQAQKLQKLQHKTKEFSIECVQRAANVRRPTP